MDPKATAKTLFTALAEGDVDAAKEAAANLADWICNGGFEVSYTIKAADMRAVCCTLATGLAGSE
jgi:hypothetical protein